MVSATPEDEGCCFTVNNRGLDATQMRFIELIIEQLTARGIMDAAALCEPPFGHLHAGGPDALFAGKEKVINGVFETLKALQPEPLAAVARAHRRHLPRPPRRKARSEIREAILAGRGKPQTRPTWLNCRANGVNR